MVQVEQVAGELPGSLTLWRITTFAQTKAEAFAKAAKIEEVNPEAFKPTPAVQIAHNDGHTADGGGIVPESIARAMWRDGAIPPDEDEVEFPRACPAGGCGED